MHNKNVLSIISRWYSLRKFAGVIISLLIFSIITPPTLLYSAEESQVDWVRQFGSVTSTNDLATAIDSDGNAYVVGTTAGALPGQTSAGGQDGFLRKYDATGNIIWTRQYGTASLDHAHAVTVAGTLIYIVGLTTGAFPGETYQGGNGDAYVRIYNNNGTHVDTYQFGTASFDSPASVSVHIGVATTSVYVVGNTQGTFPGETALGGGDIFLAKYDGNGTEEWTSQVGTTAYDEVFSVDSDASGAYIVGVAEDTYSGQSPVGAGDAFIANYDEDGTEVWVDLFGTTEFDEAHGVSLSTSTVYVTGSTEGTMPGETALGSTDAYVRKYTTAGTHQWTRQFGTTASEDGKSISVSDNMIVASGNTSGTFPGQSSSGGTDVFVQSYSASGNATWNLQLGTASSDISTGAYASSTTGYFSGYTSGTFAGETSSGGVDAFVMRALFGPDLDIDGLENEVDTLKTTFSNDFADDATTTGEVLTRGDQTIFVRDADLVNDGINASADSGGGATSAEIEMCGGASSFFLDPGDEVISTCGSVIYDVLAGFIEATFTADDGTVLTATIPEFNEMIFEPETSTFIAPVENPDPIVVETGGVETTIDPGETEVVETVTDSEGPKVKQIDTDPDPTSVGIPVNLTAIINDTNKGGSEILEAFYTIDGGAQVSLNPTDGTFDTMKEDVDAIIPAFSEAGVYRVCLTGTDIVGNIGVEDCTFLVIFDPDGGDIAGWGKFESLAGEYYPDTMATGTVKFGFFAKYAGDNLIPTGKARVRFNVGDMKFKSTELIWLVVDEETAILKGEGTINGVGNYRFKIKIVDGDSPEGSGVDKIRVKIWDKDNNNEVVYKHVMAPIDKGKVIIHL